MWLLWSSLFLCVAGVGRAVPFGSAKKSHVCGLDDWSTAQRIDPSRAVPSNGFQTRPSKIQDL